MRGTVPFAHGVMFHHFHGAGHPHVQGAMSAIQLRAMLLGLGLSRILTPAQWCERAAAGRLEPHDLCLTLDDALLCQYEIALPVFDELGLKAFWFVYSSVFQGQLERLELYRYFRTVHYSDLDGFYGAFDAAVAEQHPEAHARARTGFDPKRYLADFAFYSDADRWFRYLRDEALGPDRYNALMDHLITSCGFQVEDLRGRLWMSDTHLARLAAQGHMVGLHSTSHPTRLERLPEDQQATEYQNNLRHVQAATGVRPVAMSHPCNSYSPATLGLLRELGIQVGFRSNMAVAPGHGPLELPREDHANLLRQADAQSPQSSGTAQLAAAH